MSAAWVTYLLVAGTLLTLGARAAASALGVTGRSTRWVWAAALAGLLALGAVAPRARSFELSATVGVTSGQLPLQQTTMSQPALDAFIHAMRGTIETTLARAIATASVRVPERVARALSISWAIASVVLLLLYVGVNPRVSRARRRWPRERLHGLDVRVAPSVGPAVIGVMHAEIVVPRALLERSAEEQRLILAHEHEHLRARDNVLLGLACGAVIVLPWHPAVWYLLARLRLAIELDCDARVLRGGVAPRSYGSLLIDMAAHGAGIRIGTLALADRSTHLERRLKAMRFSRSRYAWLRGGAMSGVAGLLMLAACEAKVPTAADVRDMDVAGFEKSAKSSGAFSRFSNADFFFDGKKTTREEVLKIDAQRIGSIEVVKGARDTIFVTSKERIAQTDSGETALRGAAASRMRVRGDSSFPRVSVPELLGSKGAQPAFIIDGVLADAAAVAALRPEYVRGVHVVKGAAVDSRYPNGLIEITTGTTPAPMKERVPAPTSSRRTDTMVVRGANAEARALRMWGLVSETSTHPDGAQRVAIVLPSGAPEPQLIPLRIGGTITSSGERVPASPAAQHVALRPMSKDFAITIDGVPATQAELDALPKGEMYAATMWVRDGEKHSSDPKAVNGLMEVRTRHGATKP